MGDRRKPQARPRDNPATGAEIAQVAYATVEDVDRTVQAAHAAFLKWRDVRVVERMQPLYRYKMLLEKHQNELASTLTPKTENPSKIPWALFSSLLERRMLRYR